VPMRAMRCMSGRSSFDQSKRAALRASRVILRPYQRQTVDFNLMLSTIDAEPRCYAPLPNMSLNVERLINSSVAGTE